MVTFRIGYLQSSIAVFQVAVHIMDQQTNARVDKHRMIHPGREWSPPDSRVACMFCLDHSKTVNAVEACLKCRQAHRRKTAMASHGAVS